MPVADPRAGRLFIWLISSFILLSLVTGGAFLAMYMSQPDPTTSTWLLYVGMALVCLPWLFWLVLCMYRCISRSLGFRIVFGCGGSSGRDGAGSSGKGGSATMNGNAGAGDTEKGDSGHARSGDVVVVNKGGGDDSNPRNTGSRSSSSSSSNNDISLKSDESEVPLASAMAT